MLPVEFRQLSERGVYLSLERDQIVDPDGKVHILSPDGKCSECCALAHPVDNYHYFQAHIATIHWPVNERLEAAFIQSRFEIPKSRGVKYIYRWTTEFYPDEGLNLFMFVSDVLTARSDETLQFLLNSFHSVVAVERPF